jgi:hypothetical protein
MSSVRGESPVFIFFHWLATSTLAVSFSSPHRTHIWSGSRNAWRLYPLLFVPVTVPRTVFPCIRNSLVSPVYRSSSWGPAHLVCASQRAPASSSSLSLLEAISSSSSSSEASGVCSRCHAAVVGGAMSTAVLPLRFRDTVRPFLVQAHRVVTPRQEGRSACDQHRGAGFAALQPGAVVAAMFLQPRTSHLVVVKASRSLPSSQSSPTLRNALGVAFLRFLVTLAAS